MESGGGYRGGRSAATYGIGRGRGRGTIGDNGGRSTGGRGVGGIQFRPHDHHQQQQQSQQRYGIGGLVGTGAGRGHVVSGPTSTTQLSSGHIQGSRGGPGTTGPTTHWNSSPRQGGRGAGGDAGPAYGYGGSSGRGTSIGRGRGGRGSWGSASGQDRIVPQMQSLQLTSKDDNGGTNSVQTIPLRVNHFLLNYNPNTMIRHYNIDIKPDAPAKKGLPVKVPKTILSMVRDKLFSDDPDQFRLSMTAYDGEKNIFSTVILPTGKFKVELSKDEGTRMDSFIVEVQLVNEMRYDKLDDILSGRSVSVPRDVLQSLDVVMKENPMRQMIYAGRSFHPIIPYREDDLGRGITASRGIKHTLKPTSQGLALCMDYSVLPFRKHMPVIDFLKEHIQLFNLNNFRACRREVERALKGLKVIVTHRTTRQKFKIVSLTEENTEDISFDIDNISDRKIRLVDYFFEKYKKNIVHKNIPCLDLGKNNKKNYVPMEFCVIAEGQRFAKEHLDRYQSKTLKDISLASPKNRESTINDMMRSGVGPCGGGISQNFGIGVNMEMTKVTGRILPPPELKLGTSRGGTMKATVDREKCQWNLKNKSVIHSKQIKLWGVLNFSSSNLDRFINELISCSYRLGIRMEEPLYYDHYRENLLLDVDGLHTLLQTISNDCYTKHGDHLQILLCVLPNENFGYNNLKWVSETKVGIITQCCLSGNAIKATYQFLANLALKINAKLGGSNAELFKQPQCLQIKGHVMFIGADVKHPASFNSTSPSVAAVVATMNWPAANQYSTRICPQDHRVEKIVKFGGMCLELVNAYASVNQVRPEKIVIFRDGVSESQFDMVLNEELKDLNAEFESINYFPAITLIVAQKRHTTRLFVDCNMDVNVPPGTVVDTVITSPSGCDFYLCSHFGQIGTSKPAHYQVLQDKLKFTPNELQEFIYSICFTSAQCTKPVSLVPPVVYADRAASRGQLYYSSYESHHSSASSSSASSDGQPCKLHLSLENSMFFI